MQFDSVWRAALADLAINLSAGWFAAVVITPSLSRPLVSLDSLLLIVDTMFGVAFLLLSVRLRRETL